MSLRDALKPRIQDLAMRFMDDMRPEALALAQGEILEVGFGTALNLRHYPPEVKNLVGLDPMSTEGVAKIDERIAAAGFPVERATLRADGDLPFDAGRFDSVVTTWTLCTIPHPVVALQEMRRVLKPGGRYLFIEHGRADAEGTARWQDRLNPLWRRIADFGWDDRPAPVMAARASVLPSRVPELIESVGRSAASSDLRTAIVSHPGFGSVLIFWFADDEGPSNDACLDALSQARDAAHTAEGRMIVDRCPSEVKSRLDVWDEVGEPLSIMRRMKAQYDPKGTLNPGRFAGGI